MIDDFRDEDPGRILHEMRYGEMTAFEERPHSPYYGNADATPLYRGPARRVRALDRRHQARRASSSTRPGPRSTGSTSTPTCRATATSPTSGGTRRPGSRTSAGRTPGTRSPTATARCRASRARPASCRATPTTPRSAAPGSRASSGRTRRSPTGSRSEAADLKRRFNRDFWVEDGEYFARRPRQRRPPGRLAHLEQRPPALERDRRQVEGQGGRQAPDGPAAVLRLGHPHARRGRGALQPDRLPRRHGVAVRQLLHRLGPAPLRLQGGGRPRSPPGILDAAEFFEGRLPEAFGGYPRDADQLPGAVPDGVQPAGLVDRRPAAAAADELGLEPRATT